MHENAQESFDVERLFLPLLHQRIQLQIDSLRESYILDLGIRGLDAAPTWDEMDSAFLKWLESQYRLYHAGVSDESKARYADLTREDNETDGTEYVPCERCDGDGWDPEGYLSMTGERMYCPRCGGSGVNLV